MNEMPIYITTYNDPDTCDHHSLIREMTQRGAVDAVYAARHADLAPECVVYVYADADEGHITYGVKGDGADEWWIATLEQALEIARRGVERAVEEREAEALGGEVLP